MRSDHDIYSSRKYRQAAASRLLSAVSSMIIIVIHNSITMHWGSNRVEVFMGFKDIPDTIRRFQCTNIETYISPSLRINCSFSIVHSALPRMQNNAVRSLSLPPSRCLIEPIEGWTKVRILTLSYH